MLLEFRIVGPGHVHQTRFALAGRSPERIHSQKIDVVVQDHEIAHSELGVYSAGRIGHQ